MSYYIELVERIKQELSIDMLLPKSAAGKRSICCPLPDHDDHGPSFTIYRETNSWICWSHPGGRSAGSVLDYIMAERNVPFKEAVAIGAEMLGIEIQPPTEEERFEMERWRQREDILTTLARVSSGWLMADSGPPTMARAYLEGRGFDRAFMQQQQLGLIDIRKLYEVRAKHPLLSDFSEEQFDELGLRKPDEHGALRPLYSKPRLAIPLLRRQRVVGYTFRDLEGTHPAKYMHLPGAAGIYNEDALAHREACLTEGVPDCWTLMAWGIPAAGNLGVHAVKHAQRFRHLSTLTLVWDNDEAGRKNVLRTAKAIQAVMRDGEVRILHMPGEKDVNAWAQAGGTAEEFKALVKAAPSLLEYMIDLLPDVSKGGKFGRADRPELDSILLEVGKLSAAEQSAHLKAIGRRLECPVLQLRKDLLALVKEAGPGAARVTGEGTPEALPHAPRTIHFESVRPVTAALDFNFEAENPTANIGVWLREISNGEPTQPIEYLIECVHRPDGPAAIAVPYSARAVGDPKLMRFPDPDLPHWSISAAHPFSIPRFRDDPAGNTPSTAAIFDGIRKLLKDYIWYPDEHEYDIVSAWILMTYVFPVFGAVGFLHFHGMKGSGKSLSLDFVEKLAFNSRKMDSATEAVLFRVAHNNRSTLILDEAEKFNHPKSGTPEHSQRLLLNGSYKRGSKATRINMDTGKSEYFETYSPKCFGSINEIDHVLGDRCIVIRCLKIRKEDSWSCLDYAQTDEELSARTRLLCDQMHCWALTHFHKVRAKFRSTNQATAPDLIAREREVWIPLLTLALMVDAERGSDGPSLFDTMLKAQKEKLSEKQEKERRENIDIVVLQGLSDLFDSPMRLDLEILDAPHWYPTNKLAEEVHKQLVEDGGWPFDHKLSSNRLTGLLKKVGIVKDADIKRRREKSRRGFVVRLQEEDITAALSRLRGEGEKEESSSDLPDVLQITPPQRAPVHQQASMLDGDRRDSRSLPPMDPTDLTF